MGIKVTSSAFSAGEPIPRRYTQDGENLSPPLAWDGVPPDTAALALIVDDPDAPRPEPFVHWVLYGLSAQQRELPEGVPQGAAPAVVAGVAQGRNSYSRSGYDGPGPPPGHGVHHYHFIVYAVGGGPALPPGLDKVGLLEAIGDRTLDQGELVGTYERR